MSDSTTGAGTSGATDAPAGTDSKPAEGAAGTDNTPAGTEPLGEGGIKALQAERDARRAADQKVAALQAQIDEAARQGMTELQLAQADAKAHKAAAETASAEMLRLRTALKHGISDENAAIFLTATDEAGLTAQATALALLQKTPGTPRPDGSQGARGGTPAGSTADQFAAALAGLF